MDANILKELKAHLEGTKGKLDPMKRLGLYSKEKIGSINLQG